MKQKKLFCQLIWCLCINAGVLAQNIEQIHMKNGSVVEGYICEQIPGKSITIQSATATIVVGADSLQSTTERLVNINSLSSLWQDWAEDQLKLSGQSLKLTTLRFVNVEYKDVCIIEQGSLIKFVDFTPRKYVFLWNEIYKTVKAIRPCNQISGIEDVLVLNDGTKYVGQITEQYPGKNIKIQTKGENVITVKAAQVVQLESTPYSKKLSVMQQTPLLDRLYLKGQSEPIEGYIIRRVMNKDLTIMTKEGDTKLVAMKNIIKYQKFPNAACQVILDKELSNGEILLDGEKAWFATLQMEDDYIILSEEVSKKVAVGDTITILAKLPNAGAAVSMVKAYRKDLSILDKKVKTERFRDVFTYRDLVEKALPYGRSTTPLGNTKIQFLVREAGDYVISIQGQEGYIVINVTE